MLDDEQIENLLEEDTLIKATLGLDREAFNLYRDNVSSGLVRFGTYFFRCIGKALKCASTKNAVKILMMWPSESSQAEMQYRFYLAKEAAKETQPRI